MRSVFGFALAVACAAAMLVACNALTGASVLGTCSSDDCAALTGPDGGPLGDANPPPGTLPDGAVLPPTCQPGETACAGRVAAACVNGAWKQTSCDQACVAGKCDSWPSCRNAAGAGCGPNATSCCATSAVPGGTFNRRNDPMAPATVSKHDLDLYEVTVGRFRAFVDTGGGTRANPPGIGAGAHPRIANSGWQAPWTTFLAADTPALKAMVRNSTGTWTDAPAAREHLPINYVSWMEAFAFCAWDGGRLPTNAEWELAAAGGSEQRLYPWSSPPASTVITGRAAYNCNYTPPEQSCPTSHCSDNSSTPCNAATCLAPASCVYPPCTGCTLSDIAAVGALALGAGRWGHFDLAGNVGELVLDIDGPLATPCADCARLPFVKGAGGNPRLEVDFLFNGGAWDFASPSAVQTTAYDTLYANDTSDGVGFRCARD